MELPKIADTRPATMMLEPGTYWWCSCGLSSTQPFCDGSHQGTGFEPVQLVLEKAESVALCRCKHSGNGCRCDGTHKDLTRP